MTGKHPAPTGLGPAGSRLWRRLATVYEFAPGELLTLELAARQADSVAALEAILARDGMTTTGSAGQPRLNPAVAEVRQGRLALERLLGALALPIDADDAGLTLRQKQARKAAQSRWARRDRLHALP
jgi:hypothetical protein